MSSITSSIDRPSIRHAHDAIRNHIRRTPVVHVDGTDFGLPGLDLSFKLEYLQHSGSFKARGAFASLLLRDLPPAGVVAASGGNHGAAVAYAAMRVGVPARVFVPTVCSPAKIERIRGYGAQLVVTGDLYADALAASQSYAAESGALPIHAFDQRETLLGQGTLGLELEEQAPELDALLVAVGGAGLIGGISAWYAGNGGSPEIIGVEPELAPTLSEALRAGRPVDAAAGGIAADSLAPQRVGELGFPIVRQRVKRVVLVPDAAIRDAQRVLWERLCIVAEPGGAAALAALLTRRWEPAGATRVGIVICGANTDAVAFH